MSSLPRPSSPLRCSPCLYTMNTLASRLQNQLSRWGKGKSNLTAATRPGDCFSPRWQRGASVPQVLLKRKKQRVKRGGNRWAEAAGPRVSCRSSLTHFRPIFGRFLTVLFPHPSLPSWRCLSVSQHWGDRLSSLQSCRWNGIITMGVEWLRPPNRGHSNHNNTLSNLIRRPFVASSPELSSRHPLCLKPDLRARAIQIFV